MIRDVVGYEGIYRVNDAGEILNSKNEVLKPYDNGYGYLIVDLYKNHKKRHTMVHIVVAKSFIPNPKNYPEVNHRDENKHNNKLNNLEWCSRSYNKKYGSGRKSRSDGMKVVWSARRADDA